MISSAKLKKHLARGYVRETENLWSGQKSRFRHWVVIPVCEEPELPDTLRQWARILPEDAAMLLVVNHPENASDSRKTCNRKLLQELRQGETFGLNARQLFWIDAASQGKELHRGVGEARRIGYDTALAMMNPENLQNGLLVACDGDTRIHPDYWNILLKTVSAHPRCGAFCLGVHHQPGHTPEEEQAIRQYEKYLQDYVDGLQQAGSPYAYHSIGSAIAVRASSYLQAGGMRVYEAGEDFYFLQALRKVTEVFQMTEAVVYPSARPSDRVPFGTGRAMITLLKGGRLPVYPPEAFRQLRCLLDSVCDRNLADPEHFLSGLQPKAREFLSNDHFSAAWEKIVENIPRRPGALTTAFHQWFDALKTYRFIHSFMKEYTAPDCRR